MSNSKVAVLVSSRTPNTKINSFVTEMSSEVTSNQLSWFSHFFRFGYYSETDMTRTSEPRLWEQVAWPEGERIRQGRYLHCSPWLHIRHPTHHTTPHHTTPNPIYVTRPRIYRHGNAHDAWGGWTVQGGGLTELTITIL